MNNYDQASFSFGYYLAKPMGFAVLVLVARFIQQNRNLSPRRAGGIFLACCFSLFIFLRFHIGPHLLRLFILHQGKPGIAMVENVYRSIDRGRNLLYWQTATLVVFDYSTDDGKYTAAEAPVLSWPVDKSGRTLAIHYLTRPSGWVALDDDFGQTRHDLILGFLFSMATILGALYCLKEPSAEIYVRIGDVYDS